MPKLTATQVSAVTGEAPATGTTSEANPAGNLAAALEWARAGWNIFPLRPGSKSPLLPRAHKDPQEQKNCMGRCGREGHGAHDGTRDEATIRRWWTTNPRAGIGSNLGDDKFVFDVDIQHGGRVLQSFPETRTHYSGRGNGNRHLIYGVRPGTMLAQIGQKNRWAGDGMDIKAGFGGYVVLPPTLHEETGQPYTLGTENLGVIHDLTDDELQKIYDEAGVALSAAARGQQRGLSAVGGGTSAPKKSKFQQAGTENHLSTLLANPPVRGHGATNDWLTRVAGHYAKLHPDKRDLYEIEVRRAADMVQGEPYPQADVEKVLESIWATEESAHPEGRASINNGFVTGNGSVMFVQAQIGAGEDSHYEQVPMALFDIVCNGVAVAEDDTRSYWIELRAGGRRIERTIPAEVFGDDRALKRLLASFGVTANLPTNVWPQGMSVSSRMLMYIESQRPPVVKLTDVLGWSGADEYFVTHDGLIRADGFESAADAGVVANVELRTRDVAPFHYGFERTWEEAQSVLRQVLEFQDDETVAVFGAWWAACFLKPQFQERTAVFPFFGVEAASESGKTNGFFSLMVALNGNYRGQIAPTRPVLRDSASANRNGIVWADDLDSLEVYGEILRASTSNGTASKMDMDRNGIKNTQIVSPILISGETLGMSDQKALADRSIVISPPSPTGRRSKHGDWSQWEDVKNLIGQFKDSSNMGLTVLAGHFARESLRREEEALAALQRASRTMKGRAGDKLSVLVAGAQLLDSLLDDPEAWTERGTYTARVIEWSKSTQAELPQDNTLTMRVLPWAVRHFGAEGHMEKPTMGLFANIMTPIKVVQTGETDLLADGIPELWVSVPNLALAWAKHKMGRVTDRTETEAAMVGQMDRITVAGSSKPHRVGTETVRMRKVQPEYVALVMERASRD
jgi:hypothetical protein